MVDEGNNEIDTRVQCSIILTQSFYDFRLRLRDYHECLLGNDNHQHNDCNEYIGCDAHNGKN